ncbi:MAG: hypothetical protein ACYDC9_08205 [Dermatophilaceae bacterium]
MITIETDHSVSGIQAIAGQVLGSQVSVSQAGRLGQEITFSADRDGVVPALVAALREGGHEVVVTATS